MSLGFWSARKTEDTGPVIDEDAASITVFIQSSGQIPSRTSQNYTIRTFALMAVCIACVDHARKHRRTLWRLREDS
jgi:hypothetical protein